MNRDFKVAFLHRIGLVMLSLVGLAVFTLSAHATMTPAVLSWSPPSPFGFGSVIPPATATETFTLFNVGGMSSGTIAVTLSGSSAFVITADGCTDRALAPNKSCEVTVEYEPTTTTGDTGTLIATAENAASSDNLMGNPAPPAPADLTLSPGTFLETLNGTNFYDASSVLKNSGVTVQFFVMNVGTGTSEELTTANSSDPEFNNAFQDCRTALLPPGGTCFFTLKFTLPNGCTSGTVYHARFEVAGIFPSFVSYINLGATETCP